MKTREDYVKNFKEQLDIWNAEVARWEERLRLADEAFRTRSRARLDELRSQLDLASYQLRLVERAVGEGWKDFALGAAEARDRLRHGIAKARAHFEEDPA